MYSSFCASSYISQSKHHFPKSLMSAPFSLSLSMPFYHILIIQLNSSVTVCILSRILSLKMHILPRWLSGKESAYQCRRCRFDPWIRKIPWRKEWQPAPVFLPGKSYGQRILAGYTPWSCRVRHD